MTIRNPGLYRNSQRRRANTWIGHLDALAEQAHRQITREERVKHPKKKQPRHIRMSVQFPK